MASGALLLWQLQQMNSCIYGETYGSPGLPPPDNDRIAVAVGVSVLLAIFGLLSIILYLYSR